MLIDGVHPDVLRAAIRGCHECGLRAICTQPVPGRGPTALGTVMLIV